MTGQINQFSNILLDRNAYIEYAINNILLTINTIFPAYIIKVDGNMHTIQPIMQSRVQGQDPVTLPIIEDVPAVKWQGGDAGIIIEYQVNDVVLIGAVQRDWDILKNNDFPPKVEAPQSLRKFSITDSIILGKVSNKPPTTYVKIVNEGIEIVGDKVTVKSPDVEIIANSNINITTGNATVNSSGDINVIAAGSVDIQSTGVKIGQGTFSDAIISTTQMYVENIQGGSDRRYIVIDPGTASKQVKLGV